MGGKKRTKFHETITSPEQFEQISSEEETRMAVVDVHLDWCGPCNCMVPNYSAIWFNLEDPQSRISFW